MVLLIIGNDHFTLLRRGLVPGSSIKLGALASLPFSLPRRFNAAVHPASCSLAASFRSRRRTLRVIPLWCCNCWIVNVEMGNGIFRSLVRKPQAFLLETVTVVAASGSASPLARQNLCRCSSCHHRPVWAPSHLIG